VEYTKTFERQTDLLEQLEANGLQIPDRGVALEFLSRVGYFRSGAYRYVFRQFLPPAEVNERLREYRKDVYLTGASIEDVIRLEAFDSKLARVCSEGLLDFEIRVRAAIAHTLASKDVAAHASQLFLDDHACNQRSGKGTKFEAWQETYAKAIRAGAEDADFITHHLLKYPKQPVPIWAVTEVLSFGSLPFLFDLMQAADARAVARMFGFVHPRPFGAVLRMMVDFRNACAHGSRLFNKAFKRSLAVRHHEVVGDLLDHLGEPAFTPTPKPNQRLYIYAAVLAFMLQSHPSGTSWNRTFKSQIRKLDVRVRPQDGVKIVSPSLSMGFPSEWERHPLWNDA
jgi:abortive infection bacteriophage resistance protein